jgi:hypothetical protein
MQLVPNPSAFRLMVAPRRIPSRLQTEHSHWGEPSALMVCSAPLACGMARRLIQASSW